MGEIQQMLAEHGAAGVATRYVDKEPVGVQFALDTPHGRRTFNLPVDIDAMHQLLTRQSQAGEIRGTLSVGVVRSKEHAGRVAWRVVKDWLAAQLALVAAEMASLETVMLPYLVVDHTGTTLHQRYLERGLPALEVGS
jgi:hypothetical protein